MDDCFLPSPSICHLIYAKENTKTRAECYSTFSLFSSASFSCFFLMASSPKIDNSWRSRSLRSAGPSPNKPSNIKVFSSHGSWCWLMAPDLWDNKTSKLISTFELDANKLTKLKAPDRCTQLLIVNVSWFNKHTEILDCIPCVLVIFHVSWCFCCTRSRAQISTATCQTFHLDLELWPWPQGMTLTFNLDLKAR